MPNPSYDFGTTFDQVTITGAQLLAPSVVGFDDSFPNIPLPNDDDYHIVVVLTGYDQTGGSMVDVATITNEDIGSTNLEVGSGLAVGNPGDAIILRNVAGETQVSVIRSIVGDTITLDDKLKITMAAGSTVTWPGQITLTIREGQDAGAQQTRAETYALTELDRNNNTVFFRIRGDAGTTFNIDTTEFTATSLAVHAFIDPHNLFRADRRTPRLLATRTAAVQAPGIGFVDELFLSNGGGGVDNYSGSGFVGSMEPYHTQHVPIRMRVDVTGGTDFSGNVNVLGFRTVWSRCRGGAKSAGQPSIQIDPCQLSQFQVGDSVTIIHEITGSRQGPYTVQSKTAPNTLTFSSNLTGPVPQHSICGIEVAEAINVGAGIGTYYTADGFVYVYDVYVDVGPSEFDYELYQTVQGWCGQLLDASGTAGEDQVGHSPNSSRQANPVNLVSVAQTVVGDGVAPTYYGLKAGALIQPRATLSTFRDILGTAAESTVWWGHRDQFGNVTSGCAIIDGTSQSAGSLWEIQDDPSNMMGANGTLVMNTKMPQGGDQSSANVLGLGKFRVSQSLAFTRNVWQQESTDVQCSVVLQAIEQAGGVFTGGSGASFQINAPTDLNDFADIIGVGAIVREVSFIPEQSFDLDTEPIRVTRLNVLRRNSGGGQSNRITSFPNNVDFTGRIVDGYATEIQMRNHNGSTVRIESAATCNILLQEENGAPVPGMIVFMVNGLGERIFTAVTDAFGKIPQQEVVTHRWEKSFQGGVQSFLITETPPAQVSLTEFGPFTLSVINNPGVQEGYAENRRIYPLRPFDPDSLINDVIELRPPFSISGETATFLRGN